ncbi:MAG TPA: sigma-70 family RNA polymerase sigma factor [Melioribacteraceae bacterium]|nr:sigma-70 family RNA polymerase sigma factor [Melioribacteraceae bacterium]
MYQETDEKSNNVSNIDYAEFEREVIPYSNSLYNFAFQMTGDSDEANDLVQETLIKAFRFFDRFERGTNIKGWLFRILKNSFINEFRKGVKGPARVDYDDIQNFYESISESEIKTKHYEEDAFNQLLDDDISTALEKLPEDFRTVIILNDLEGFTYEEIADFVDCPVGTVRSRLHRARKMLYSQLYDYAKNRGYVSK